MSFVTTDLVLSETFTLLSLRLGRPAALAFWDGLRQARIPILPVTSQELDAAWRIIGAFPDHAFSVTDATTFALMERLAIRDAFAFDHHFHLYRYGVERRSSLRVHPISE